GIRNTQTQAYSKMGAATTAQQVLAKQQLAAELKALDRSIDQLQDELYGVFYARETDGTMTVELPGGKLPSPHQSGFDLFESVVSQPMGLESIDTLMARVDKLDTSAVSFTRGFGQKGQKKTTQLMRDSAVQPAHGNAIPGIVQRVVVTVQTFNDDQ